MDNMNEKQRHEGKGLRELGIDVHVPLQLFVNDLVHHREAVLHHVDQLIRRPGKTPDAAALGIYVDAALKAAVFDKDPFAPRYSGDEEHQADRRAIATIATAHLARSWLRDHPQSSAALSVLRLGLDAPVPYQQELVHELWPMLVDALDNPIWQFHFND
jgi:hypothetical protein